MHQRERQYYYSVIPREAAAVVAASAAKFSRNIAAWNPTLAE
jgi:hypothetical protein